MGINRRDFLKLTAASGLLLATDVKPTQASAGRELPPRAVGFLYDSTLCIGCKSCMFNCKKYNTMEGGALFKEGADPRVVATSPWAPSSASSITGKSRWEPARVSSTARRKGSRGASIHDSLISARTTGTRANEDSL